MFKTNQLNNLQLQVKIFRKVYDKYVLMNLSCSLKVFIKVNSPQTKVSPYLALNSSNFDPSTILAITSLISNVFFRSSPTIPYRSDMSCTGSSTGAMVLSAGWNISVWTWEIQLSINWCNVIVHSHFPIIDIITPFVDYN